MSILTLFQSSHPNASLWTHTTVQFSLPYFSISIALNIILTLLLISRLYFMSARAKRSIDREHAATYMSIASMLIESSMLYAVTGVIFVVTYVLKSDVQNLVPPVLSQVVCISPELIILVVMGRAVTSRTHVHQISQQPTEVSMKFRKPRESRDMGTQLTTVAESEDAPRNSMGSASKDLSVA